MYNQNEVFKGYGVISVSGETKYLGVLDGTHGKLGFCGEILPAGIVITRKNITTGEEVYFCHGASDGNLTLVYNIFNNVRQEPVIPLKEPEIKTNKKKEVHMGFFSWILILIVLYCPWLIWVIVVLFIFATIYSTSPVLFWLLIGGIIVTLIVALVWSDRQD